MCARVVLTTGPRANSPHESLSAPSTCESAMALDQPEVEPPPQHGEQHVFPPAIVVDRPVPLPYAVPMPVDRPYPVPYPVPVEKQVLVQVPVHIPVPVDRPFPVYVPVPTTMGWPHNARAPLEHLLGDPTGWPLGLQNVLQRLLQEIAHRPEVMVPSIAALLPPLPEASAPPEEDPLTPPPPPPAIAGSSAGVTPLCIEAPHGEVTSISGNVLPCIEAPPTAAPGISDSVVLCIEAPPIAAPPSAGSAP